MSELLKKWIEEHNNLLKDEMSTYNEYGDVKNMPDKVYCKYRIILEKRLVIYNHIKELKKLLEHDLSIIQDDETISNII